MYLHIISRATAKKYGLKHYYTGKSCNYGQLSIRRTDSKFCLCYLHQAVRLAYRKEWRKKNPATTTKWRKKKRLESKNPTFLTTDQALY